MDYPGAPAAAAGVLLPDGGWEALGDGPPPPDLVRGRTCVLAVGSNASPQVLDVKLGGAGRAAARSAVACVPYVVSGLGVAHSAHVSPGGYVPATPYVRPGGEAAVVASWFDAGQLAALDATEPNYRRLPVPGSVRAAPAAAEVYVSRWGVLAPDGAPLPPVPQVRVHAVLARDAVLAALAPLHDAAAAITALRDPATARRVRERLVELGWVAPTGW